MEKFTPTLDWGNELWVSLIWIAKGWAYAAIATLIVLFAIARLTTWGKQFWRITGAYFTGVESVKVWLWLSGILLLVIAGVRVDVLLSYYQSDISTAFQAVAGGLQTGDQALKESGKDGFYHSLLVFAILATLFKIGRAHV